MEQLVDLSHSITDGMSTYPGLPGPKIGEYLSRSASRRHYAPGVEFHIGAVEMVGNTGTYLDVPFHRYPDGYDLDGLALERIAGVPGVCLAGAGPALSLGLVSGIELEGRAVLFATGWSRHWATDAYGGPDHPFLSERLAEALVRSRVAVVGIDSVNIDDTATGARPVHSMLLQAGVPIVEHLTGLEALIGRPFRFFAVPPRVRRMGTWPVRAFAIADTA